MRVHALFAGVAVVTALCGPARAGIQTTISDATDDIAYWGAKPTDWFGGHSYGDVIGTGFNTSKIVVTETAASHGALNLTFAIYTQFSGVDCFGSTCARYADLFLRTPAKGYSAAPFNYAVALGFQHPNGGIGTAGLYTVSGFATSQDIWASRRGFIYGGAYVPHDNSAAPEATPTVLRSGTYITSATIGQSRALGGYIETVSLSLTGSAAAALRNGFDVLWGTGDCANDTIFGSVAAAPVPEPAGIGLLCAGLAGLLVIRHRTSQSKPARRPPSSENNSHRSLPGPMVS